MIARQCVTTAPPRSKGTRSQRIILRRCTSMGRVFTKIFVQQRGGIRGRRNRATWSHSAISHQSIFAVKVWRETTPKRPRGFTPQPSADMRRHRRTLPGCPTQGLDCRWTTPKLQNGHKPPPNRVLHVHSWIWLICTRREGEYHSITFPPTCGTSRLPTQGKSRHRER